MIGLYSNQHISLVKVNFNVGQLNKLRMYLCFFAFIPLGDCHSQKEREHLLSLSPMFRQLKRNGRQATDLALQTTLGLMMLVLFSGPLERPGVIKQAI